MKAGTQVPRHKILLNDNMTIWIDYVPIWVNVKANESHSDTILVEEYVRMRTAKKK